MGAECSPFPGVELPASIHSVDPGPARAARARPQRGPRSVCPVRAPPILPLGLCSALVVAAVVLCTPGGRDGPGAALAPAPPPDGSANARRDAPLGIWAEAAASSSSSSSGRRPVRPPGRLQGRVVDPEGRALADVQLLFVPLDGGRIRPRRSAQDGGFLVHDMDLGPWEISASIGQRTAARARVDLCAARPEQTLELTVRPSRGLNLRLLDLDDRPLEEALAEHGLRDHGTTRIELDQGDPELGHGLGRPFGAAGGAELEVAEGTRIRLRLLTGTELLDAVELGPEPLPEGAVLRADAARIAGLQARVTVRAGSVPASTSLWIAGEHASWLGTSLRRGGSTRQHRLTPGRWNLCFLAPGSAFEQRELVLGPGGELELDAPELGPELRLRGRVRTPAGAPASASVRLERRSASGAWLALPRPLAAFSGVDGEFDLGGLAPGTYRAACPSSPDHQVVFELPRDEPLEVLYAPFVSARAGSAPDLR